MFSLELQQYLKDLFFKNSKRSKRQSQLLLMQLMKEAHLYTRSRPHDF